MIFARFRATIFLPQVFLLRNHLRLHLPPGETRAEAQGQRHLPVRGLQQDVQEREEPAPPLQDPPRAAAPQEGQQAQARQD